MPAGRGYAYTGYQARKAGKYTDHRSHHQMYASYQPYEYSSPSPRRLTPSPPKRKSPSPPKRAPSPPKRKVNKNARILALVSANVKAANVPVARRRTLMNSLRTLLRRG
jgi:hypothetical protein